VLLDDKLCYVFGSAVTPSITLRWLLYYLGKGCMALLRVMLILLVLYLVIITALCGQFLGFNPKL
jgi:hypothetical protein